MDAGAVNTAGGICELAGLGLVAREYLAALQHHGHLAAAQRRIADRWRRIVAWWRRRILGQPTGTVHREGRANLSIRATTTATGQQIPGKFTPHAGQSVEDRIEQLGQVINRVIDWAAGELQRRDRAIHDTQAEAEAKLQAEARRLRGLIAQVQGELQDLDKRTTGDLRLRLDGLWLLLIGIVFTTWPDLVADHVLGWLPWPVFYLALAGYVVWRLVGSTTRAIHSE
jgi:hypothetical protein